MLSDLMQVGAIVFENSYVVSAQTSEFLSNYIDR